ncbi:hypothetical protein NCG89_13255 [Spongiibacter taiwanensis]|uniref:hypothetical protein n=1 Tax=Spongiibacter taiwanensis TaxID=1748242 RepID=UPI0020359710|nr:hypothetical protein [Spongiibacter taiwanensis]USA42494.1 hypothetical protein NCG89_13255 [Spongiibacter taiwanensis]
MAINHRLIYQADVGIFLVLALPGLNALAIELLLSTGQLGDAIATHPLVLSLCGIAGCLGLGLALIRLQVADSRQIVGLSLMVKVLASGWLFYGYISGVSQLMLWLAVMDVLGALIFLMRLIRPS